MPINPAVIAGGASLLGDVVGGLFSASQASKQRKFQERMSNTAHQREVADLKAAGLNPILTAMGGSGASTPAGAQAQIPQGAGTRMVQSAVAAAANKAQVQNIHASTDLLKAQADEARSKAEIIRAEVPWSAHNAQSKAGALMATVEEIAGRVMNLKKDFDIKIEDVRNRKLTNEQLEKLQPILLEVAALDKRAKELGIPALENDARFQSSTIGEANPLIKLLLELVRGRAVESYRR